MKQKIKNIFLFFFITLVSVYSCVDDDVCDKMTTPRLTSGFKDVAGETLVVPELFVDKINTDGSVTKEGPYMDVDSLKISLNALSNQTVLYLYLDENTTDSDKDIITIKYKTEQEFVSKACGFKIIYTDMVYELTQKKSIEKITPNTTEIRDESENLYITY